ncbi:hypothetical protein [Salinimicrobium sp. WS361]
MTKFFYNYLPDFKNPVGKILWSVFAIAILGLLLMTAGYFSGKALYYFTH